MVRYLFGHIDHYGEILAEKIKELRDKNQARIIEFAFHIVFGRAPSSKEETAGWLDNFKDGQTLDNILIEMQICAFRARSVGTEIASFDYFDLAATATEDKYFNKGNKLNILILSTYPINDPKHGGQIRVRSIYEKYKSMAINVQVAGVLGSDQYAEEHGFTPFPGNELLEGIISNPFLMEDYAIGKLFAVNDSAYGLLKSVIKLPVDVIEVEHPWLFEFALRYRKENVPFAKLIYSSHNIEFKLKKDIIETYMGREYAEYVSNLVEKIERQAIRECDVALAVSQTDVDFIKQVDTKPVFLAPNGVKPWFVSINGKHEAAKIANGFRYALYCASAHPPNMTGFFSLFAGGFGSLKPDEKLIIAGGAGWAIIADKRVHESAKLSEKVINAGQISSELLSALLDGAHCIILPLTQGGGTNLKTAEALWSGKYIVATSIAMRGFERFIGQRGIYIADDPTTFKRALRNAMQSAPFTLTREEVRVRRCVLWEHTLAILPEVVSQITEKSEFYG